MIQNVTISSPTNHITSGVVLQADDIAQLDYHSSASCQNKISSWDLSKFGDWTKYKGWKEKRVRDLKCLRRLLQAVWMQPGENQAFSCDLRWNSIFRKMAARYAPELGEEFLEHTVVTNSLACLRLILNFKH